MRPRRLRSFSFETLECRLTPTASPLDGWFLPSAEELAEQGASPVTWQGANTFAFDDQWIAAFDGIAGHRTEQLSIIDELLEQSAPQLNVQDQLGADGLFLFESPSGTTFESISDLLSNVPGFRYVEPNFVLAQQEVVPDDSTFSSQWALNNTGQSGGAVDADIDAPEAWEITTGSSGVVAAVIDSGVQYTHPDLIANMWINPGEIPGDGLDNDGNGYVDDIYGYDFANNDSDPMDDDGHGTAVAGIIAADTNNGIGVAGINWGGKIMALKYARRDFVANTADVVEAINYATMMRRDYGVNVRVTNNSYGIFGPSQAVSDAIEAGGDAGIIYVASAGNTNTDNDFGPQYPASFPLDSILSVASTTRTDAKSGFSSFGATSVDLGAPGSSVRTTRLTSRYSNFSGTSAAAPMVAGVVALLWDYAPYASVEQIVAAILDGTDPNEDLADITVSGGRLNAYNSLLELGLHVAEITPDVDSIVDTPPTTFTVRFTQEVDEESLDPEDSSVNGIAADSLSILQGDTVQFSFATSPVFGDGLQQFSIAEGNILRASDGDGLAEFSGTFRYDAVPMTAQLSSPTDGSVVATPLTELLFAFSEVIDPSSLDPRDIIIDQGVVTNVEAIGPQEARVTLAGVEKEGPLHISIPAGAIKDTVGNPIRSYAATLELDVNVVPLDNFTRPEPYGSLIFNSVGNEGLLNEAFDSDIFAFDVQPGEAVLAVVHPTSSTVTLNGAFLSEGGVVTANGPGESLYVPLRSLAEGGEVLLWISGDEAIEYTFDIYRNTALEIDETSPIELDETRLELGSARYAATATITPNNQSAPATDVDLDIFTVDLSGSVGNRVDVVIVGHDGLSFANDIFFWESPSGGESADGVRKGDTLVLEDYLVEEAGIYTIQLFGTQPGTYSVIVTDQLVLETEPNNATTDDARLIDPARSGFGFVGVPDVIGPYNLQVDASQSQITLDARVFLEVAGLDLPILEQAPGSLEAAIAGGMTIDLTTNEISFDGATLDLIANAGAFQPSFRSADFAGEVDLFGLTGYAAIRNIALTVLSDPIAFDPSGFFDPADILFEFTDGEIAYSALGASGSFPANTPDTGNAAATLGQVEFLPGELRVTVPLRMNFIVSVPLGFGLELDFTATIVATAPLPVSDPDHFAFDLREGELATLSLDAIGNEFLPADTPFIPELMILDPDGVPVISPTTGLNQPGSDVSFVAEKTGTYRAVVTAASGQGEYLLDLETAPPAPTVTIAGPTEVVRGQPSDFTFFIDDPAETTSTWIYHIDWDGDGNVDDQQEGGPSLTASHIYTDLGSYGVTVSATPVGGETTAAATRQVDVVMMALQADPNDSARVNLVVGGTTGHDFYYLADGGWWAIAEDAEEPGPGAPALPEYRELPGFNGDLILYLQDGSDSLFTGPLSSAMRIFSGEGDDTIIAGPGNDFVDAGPGNDLVQGVGGNDTLLGGPGADQLFGLLGNDVLVGEDDADFLFGGAGLDTLLGGDGGDFLAGEADGDVFFGGNGSDWLVELTSEDLVIGSPGGDIIVPPVAPTLLLATAVPAAVSDRDGETSLEQQPETDARTEQAILEALAVDAALEEEEDSTVSAEPSRAIILDNDVIV